jgi:hypothetical protein
MEVSVKKLVEVSWENGKNRDTMTPQNMICPDLLRSYTRVVKLIA